MNLSQKKWDAIKASCFAKKYRQSGRLCLFCVTIIGRRSAFGMVIADVDIINSFFDCFLNILGNLCGGFEGFVY